MDQKDENFAFVTKYFSFGHLPPHLQTVSQEFRRMALYMLNNCTNDDEQLKIGLHKLLEAKDCAVRACV